MARAGWGFLGVKGTRSVNVHSVAVVDLGGPKAVHGDYKRARTVVTPHVDVIDAGYLLDRFPKHSRRINRRDDNRVHGPPQSLFRCVRTPGRLVGGANHADWPRNHPLRTDELMVSVGSS